MQLSMFIADIKGYAPVFLILSILSLVGAIGLFFKMMLDRVKNAAEDKEISRDNLKNLNAGRRERSAYGYALRKLVAPDGLDPNPLSYTTIMDGGREKYIRTFTIVQKPKMTTFARTFSSLFNFPGCTSSVFLKPIPEEEMSRKLDNNITILASEYTQAAGDVNRRRKLATQASEMNGWAEKIENGENKFFYVGFLFSLYADSLQELNKQSDSFYAEALAKNIVVSGCYGLQAEAYALNGPFNGIQTFEGKTGKMKPFNEMIMDKYSVSTLFNYLQSNFSHKSGIPIGRDMLTGNPVIFDLFDQSHDSMSLAIAGKPGSGKSLTIKTMAARQILFGWHYVVVDSQQRKGTSEGEYAAEAIAAGGGNFQISNSSKECLNLFDISETIRSEKITEDSVRAVRTLDIAGKVATLTNILCSMILNSADKSFDSIHEEAYVRRILTDTAVQTYSDFGIMEGDVDSLYERKLAGVQDMITGLKRKTLPTISDFYKRILLNSKNNTEQELKKAYSLIIYALKDYVRELYYTRKSIRFLSKNQVEKLPVDENGARYYVSKENVREEIVCVRGVRAYYDGQSTISINRDCPFANFDISMLPDDEKKLARQIAMAWITENFIKKNSERMDASYKLVVVLDEVHECYKDTFARNTVDITVREARKRNVGIILSTQTLKEYDNYPETQSILKLVECKFVFKQDFQDRDYLVDSLGITESQADMIVGSLGGSDRLDEEDRKRHRGEMCIVDNKKVCFCKVDYLRETEALIADTNAAEIERLIRVSGAA